MHWLHHISSWREVTLITCEWCPFIHLYHRKGLMTHYFSTGKKLCKYAQICSLGRLGTNETTNFLTKHMQTSILLESNLSPTQFSFSHQVTSIVLDTFWMNVFFHFKGFFFFFWNFHWCSRKISGQHIGPGWCFCERFYLIRISKMFP